MAAKYYADRGFITINGVQKVNLKSVSWTVDESLTRVETMTANRTSAGYKKGNRKISGKMELEVQDDKAEIDLAFLYGQDVNIICQLGNDGERWSLGGIAQASQEFSGSVGDASKSLSFEALTAVNEGGPGVNSDIGF
jgi:hypothetical protein